MSRHLSFCVLLTLALFLWCRSSAAQPHLFITDPGTGTILRINPTGSPNNLNFTTLVSTNGRPVAVAVDELNGKLYWTDEATNTIERSNLDGTNVQSVITSAQAGLPQGIAVDQARGMIYWTDSQMVGSRILRARTDGTGVQTIIDKDLFLPQEIEVLPLEQRIYWVDTGSNTVNRAALDGTAREQLPFTGRLFLGGLAINFATNELYLSARLIGATGLPDIILRSNLNGTAPQNAVVLAINASPLGVAVDQASQFAFWIEKNGSFLNDVRRAPLASPTPFSLLTPEAPRHLYFLPACGPTSINSDGDSAPDCSDSCVLDPLKAAPGACGCGLPDTDSDGDGTADCIDLCASDPGKLGPGACGCGTSDGDSDLDGTLNCFEQCPNDPLKTEPGVCGCGAFEFDGGLLGVQCQATPLSCTEDRDQDGNPDCNDLCPTDSQKVVPGICGCELFENVFEPGALNCDVDPLLAFETVILQPPTVIIRGNDVTVILKKFAGVVEHLTLPLRPGTASLVIETPLTRAPLKFRYEIRLRELGASRQAKDDIRRKTTKRNAYTFKDLSPGTYTVKYRAQIIRKKKVVDNTNFSPAARFVIP